MRISGTEPSSVILSQTMKFKKLKSDYVNWKIDFLELCTEDENTILVQVILNCHGNKFHSFDNHL